MHAAQVTIGDWESGMGNGERLGIQSEATVKWRLGMRHGYKTRLLSCSKFKKKIPCLWRKKLIALTQAREYSEDGFSSRYELYYM